MATRCMNRNTMLGFYSRVLFVTSLICLENKTVAEWKSLYSLSFYDLASFPNSMLINEAIVGEETNAPTITSCSRFCAKRERYSMYYNYNTAICYCNTDFDDRLDTDDPSDDGSSEIMYGYITESLYASTNASTFKYEVQPYKVNCLALYSSEYRYNAVYTVKPMGENLQDTFCNMDTLGSDMDAILDVGADDCLHWLQLGYTEDGVYNIRLSNGTTVRAWCDQKGGGWTVIQRRKDGSVDFGRVWTEYVNGFGDVDGEYWLGLEAIHLLAEQTSTLRIDMESFENQTAYALYEDFSLASVSDKYRLSIGTFTGNCGNSLGHHNNYQFTTSDSDNDGLDNENCAIGHHGSSGWWYTACQTVNLNGVYFSDNPSPWAAGINWWSYWNYDYSLKTCSMSTKRTE